MEEKEQSSNRRIAKNTLALYVRMFLTMIVGLYTSRVVLATLGVEDYGVYGVVGGITSMLGFLNASMSGATSRFLTFELGRGDKKRLEKTFSSAMIVHMGIAAVVLVLAETVGLWFLCNKLVIPPERMTAAHWVYQLSILSSMLAITQVPYNATIIAHENMNVYAYVEILNSVLKLLIVYLLTIGDFDKLILYAVLMLAVSVTVMMTYRIYCVRHYSESHFHWVWDKAFLKPLLSFSGWDLYGNIAGTAKQQGTVMLLNMFFGPVVNTGANIANIVMGTLSSLSANVIVAFRPQIIKQYALLKKEEMSDLVAKAIMFSSLLLGYLAFPIVSEMDFVLNLWLGQIPEYSVTLAQIAVFNALISNMNMVILIAIHATGNIRTVSFYGGTIYLINIVVDYFLLKFVGINAYWVCGTNCLFMGAVLAADLFLYKKQIIEINLKWLIVRKMVPMLLVAVINYSVGLLIIMAFSPGWLRFVYQVIIILIIESALYYAFVFSCSDRAFCSKMLLKVKMKLLNIYG